MTSQQRMIEEEEEQLTGRIQRLEIFTLSPDFKRQVEEADRVLLFIQLRTMKRHQSILSERISQLS